MQPRFAALLFALGLVDLAIVNLGLGQEVFADSAMPVPEVQPFSPSPPSETPPAVTPPAVPPPAPPAALAPAPRAPAPDPLSAQTDRAAAPASEPAIPAVVPPSAGPTPSGDAPASGVAPPGLGPAQTGAAAPALADAKAPAAVAPPGEASSASTSAESRHTAPASDVLVGFPDKASSILTSRAREELLALAARLRQHPEDHVHIVGYTDARGTREFNLDLGGRRARAVFELLVRAGVSPEQLETESRGEEEPRVTGASERVWAANRRVEITIGSEGASETP
jgi:peptidoglycan-associated lipoprotein